MLLHPGRNSRIDSFHLGPADSEGLEEEENDRFDSLAIRGVESTVRLHNCTGHNATVDKNRKQVGHEANFHC